MPRNPIAETFSELRTIAFLGNYLPRKCGIATLTSDLLEAVAAREPQGRCFAVAVNDVEGYQYTDVVRFEAFRITADPWWHEQAQRAFDCFLGGHDLGLHLYVRQTGGCRDSLHAVRGNENQGAESTLAFLMSLAEMRLTQKAAIGVPQGGLAASMTQ